MKPWKTVAKAKGPAGLEVALAQHDDEWVIRQGGFVLMTSRTHGSEDSLARFALERVKGPKTVLVGGLGLGFTLRAVLDQVGPDVKVVVAESFPALVEWNRTFVGHLAGRPLDDARVEVRPGDVEKVMRKAPQAFDVILLDVDNGPTAKVHDDDTDSLYSTTGIARCRQAMKKGGVLGVWSAGPDERYRDRLSRLGLKVEVKKVTARGDGRGDKHVLFFASAT